MTDHPQLSVPRATLSRLETLLNRTSIATAVLAVTLACIPATAPAATGIPSPRDVPYSSKALEINVDATDVVHRIFRVQEIIPVVPGPFTLLYPQWIPGYHAPSGPIDKLAGLKIKANGKEISWKRDEYNMYAFHVEIPKGTSTLDVEFRYLSPQNDREGLVVMTPEMLNLQWNAVTLYPAGYYARQIRTDPSMELPAGWKFGSALEVASRDGDTVHFRPIDYDDLVDSPVYAGKYFKRLDLDPGAGTPVHMDIVADNPKYLKMTPQELQDYRNLVQQMYKLYGTHHYNHYDFLLSLSDEMGPDSLEHHRSNEVGTAPDYFTEWNKNWAARDLQPHEFNHSWNGKYRRPVGLNTPNFNVPMGDSMLWVYEGQTQFWGLVMTARSGLWSQDQFRETIAAAAAKYDKGCPGLATWRNVQDTTNDPIIENTPLPYPSYQGSANYYSAGAMIWLDVDGKLRELTHDRKSLDDFARIFFGTGPGAWDVDTYTFADVVKALNDIAPYHWSKYLRTRLDGHGPLIGGLESHGWKLIYTDQPSEAMKKTNLTYSLGLSMGTGGIIADVLWDGPAFNAGLSPGMTIVAVDGQNYAPDVLIHAVGTSANHASQPIKLRVKNFDRYKTVYIDYHRGLKYPHIVRDTKRPDTLSELLEAR